MDSWQYFDRLLHETNVVGTPGSGFGSCGEGYFRLSAFGFRETWKSSRAHPDQVASLTLASQNRIPRTPKPSDKEDSC